MLSRFSPPLVAFGGSVLLLAALIGALYWTGDHGRATQTGPLIVWCAEAMRLPMDAIQKDYEKEFGQNVIIRYDSSQTILVNFGLTGQGDLYLPADDSYVQLAKDKGLIGSGDVFNLAQMHAVVIVRPNFPTTIKTWNDLLAPGNKLAIGNTDTTAIGKVLKEKLEAEKRWDQFHKRTPKEMVNVNQVLNSVKIGSIDAGIVWDAVASPHSEVTVVHLKELENVQARVQIAIAKASTQRDAAHQFIRYLRAADKGALHWKAHGFSNIEERGAFDEKPELVVHAGAMLRPALQEALDEFEKRENVRITRVYNGCGILVSQMKTGELPDVYFACDTSFMNMMQDEFNPATNISSNQMVIAVKKGNPEKIFDLLDLGKPGLRVGVGHDRKCALGALTKETFLQTGVMKKVAKNIVVTAATGDDLVNKLWLGTLDAVVAYRSNVLPFAADLDTIPITGVKCAKPSQPIAVSKSSSHPELSERLTKFLREEKSRERFEKSGFTWEVK
jgi:molybdate transport system substrate-binding protein